jgi:SAM-dependent methyltransferase
MNLFRWLPRSWKKRMAAYTPVGFPDARACGAFYDTRTTIFDGDDMMTLEYSSVEAQRALFARAVDALPPHGRILDLGCGLGHLAAYLDDRGITYEAYRGIDVSPRMVERAAERFAGRDRFAFEVRDVLNEPLEGDIADVGYILSVLGYPIGDEPMAAMMSIVREVFFACRDGVVFSHLAAGRKPGLKFTTVPDELAARCEAELGACATVHDNGEDFTYLLALRHSRG